MALTVLNYHSVQDVADTSFPWVVTKNSFAAQMQLLKDNHIAVLDVRDLRTKSDLQKLVRSKSNTVLLTFDDCFADNVDNVLPILKTHNFDATFFCVGKTVSEISQDSDWTTKGEYNHNTLKCMNIAQLKALSEGGFTLGFHSYSHQSLINASPDTLDQEIHQTVQQLAQAGITTEMTFAAPYGVYQNRRTVRCLTELLQQHGYYSAFLGKSGHTTSWDNLLCMPRIPVLGPHTMSDFEGILKGQKMMYFFMKDGYKVVRFKLMGR